MYITQEQVDQIIQMDKQGARIRLIGATVGLPGIIVKKILLGELSTGDQEPRLKAPELVETEPDLGNVEFMDEPIPTLLHEEAPPAPKPVEQVPEPTNDIEVIESEPESDSKIDAMIIEALGVEEFVTYVEKTTVERAECHIWEGLMFKGEPHTKYKRIPLPLYRLVHYRAFGTFPFREMSCRMHPRCINPNHLE